MSGKSMQVIRQWIISGKPTYFEVSISGERWTLDFEILHFYQKSIYNCIGVAINDIVQRSFVKTINEMYFLSTIIDIWVICGKPMLFETTRYGEKWTFEFISHSSCIEVKVDDVVQPGLEKIFSDGINLSVNFL